MADDVRIPTIIRPNDKDKLRSALSAMSDDEIDSVHAAVARGTSLSHAVNIIHSQRAQDAARGEDIGGKGELTAGDATPLETAAVTAGNAATFGGVPTIAAALGHGEGADFAARKRSNVADAAEMTAQNPIAASIGEGVGLVAPAVGGAGARTAGEALGLVPSAAESLGAPSLMRLAAEGAKSGAALGVPLGALQTDTGTAGSIAGNALLGGAQGAATGALGAVIPGAALRLMPSLGTTTVGEAARAPSATLLRLGTEGVEGLEDAAVNGSSAAMNAAANIAPQAGKWTGAAAGNHALPVVGGVLGAQGGEALGLRAAEGLRNAAVAPYTGGSMPVPSTGEAIGADVGPSPPISIGGDLMPTPPTQVASDPLPAKRPISGAISSPIPDIGPPPDRSPALELPTGVSARRPVLSPGDAGYDPSAFPQQGAAGPGGYSVDADMLREGLLLPGESRDPRGPRMDNGISPLGQAAVDAARQEAGTGSMRNPLRLTPQAAAEPPANPAQEAATAVQGPEAQAGLRLSSIPPSDDAAATRELGLKEGRDILGEANAVDNEYAGMVPRNGFLRPELFPEAQGAALGSMAPDKMPARLLGSREAQRIGALPREQQQAALDALARAHGTAPWQAGGVADELGLMLPGGAPAKAEARYFGVHPLTGQTDRYTLPLPSSMEGAHTLRQEMSGEPWKEHNPLMLRAIEDRKNAVDPMAPFVKQQAEAIMRAGLEQQGGEAPAPGGAEPPDDFLRTLAGVKKPAAYVPEDPDATGVRKEAAVKASTSAERASAKADALPRDRGEVLAQILDANGIRDHDSAQADAAYKAWKAGGRKGPKPTSNLGGMLDAFQAERDKPGSTSSLLEAFEKETKSAKTWRDIKPALAALAEALGVDEVRLPDEVNARHIAQDADRSAR